jgi:hypothetical protein
MTATATTMTAHDPQPLEDRGNDGEHGDNSQQAARDRR